MTAYLLLSGRLPYDPLVAYALPLLMGVLAWLGVAAVLIVMSQPPGKRKTRRILLVTLLFGVGAAAVQSALMTDWLLNGSFPDDLAVAYAPSLVCGGLVWLGSAAILLAIAAVGNPRFMASSSRAEVSIQRPLQDTVGICVAAAQAMGWEVTQQPNAMTNRARLIGKERETFSWRNPATLEMEIEPLGESRCLVRMTTSNFGLRLVQSGYVKHRLDATREAITQRA
jgi:hypothetical protein